VVHRSELWFKLARAGRNGVSAPAPRLISGIPSLFRSHRHDRGYPRHGDAVRGAAKLHVDRKVADVVSKRDPHATDGGAGLEDQHLD
jgi:hypothetical protein